jgi:metallo-beta-lactamase family protein
MVHHPTESARPAVVITGKGGFSSSRIVNYLKANTAPSSVRFVGWRAQGTLGHTIQIRGPHGGHVEPDGLRYEI